MRVLEMKRPKVFWLIVCLIMGLLVLFPKVAPSQSNPALGNFYVAPYGRDDWSGKLADPNSLRNDGPFATLSRARDAVRSLRASGTAAAPIRVLLRGGNYFLEEALVFGPEDSGTP